MEDDVELVGELDVVVVDALVDEVALVVEVVLVVDVVLDVDVVEVDVVPTTPLVRCRFHYRGSEEGTRD